MNVIILGSGGCVSTPRACCNCRVCTASLPAILADIKKQGTKYGSALEYYEASGLIYTKEISGCRCFNYW